MRHAGPLVAFLLALPGCLQSSPPAETTAVPSAGQGAGGTIMSALPTNITLAILRPGPEMALLATVDGSTVLFNTGQADDPLLTDWMSRLGTQRVALLIITNPAAPFSGGCPQVAAAAEIALLVTPSATQCEGSPPARSLDSLRIGQVLQVGSISIGVMSIQPMVATLDYGAVRILVVPEPACPTLTKLAHEGLAAPDLMQTAEANPCRAWDHAPAVAFATQGQSQGEPHLDRLRPGDAIHFTSDGTGLIRLL